MNTEFVQLLLTNIMTVVLSIISAKYFFSSFFSLKQPIHLLKILVYLTASFMFFGSLQFVNNRFLNMVVLTACIVLIAFLFSTHWRNYILFSILFVAISSICEFITGMFSLILFNVAFSELQQGVMRLGGMLFSKFLALVLFALIRMKKHHSLVAKQRFGWGVLFSLPTTTLLILIILYYIMYTSRSNASLQTYIIICMSCLSICNLLVFRFIDTIWKTTETEQRLAVAASLLREQENQYSLIVTNQQKIAKIQHDNKNVLLGIQSELVCKKYEEALKQIHSHLSLISLSDKVLSGNPTIDTIVNVKTINANEHGIGIEFQFRNIQNLKVDSIDLSILLGNALDNAIEATTKVPSPNRKTIALLIVLKDDIINIVITNPVVKNIDSNHLETDKKEKQLHGYGIINMRTILKRYAGSLIFSCHDLIFRTTILLPNCHSTSDSNDCAINLNE